MFLTTEQQIEEILIELQRGIDKFTIIVEYFNILVSEMDRFSR